MALTLPKELLVKIGGDATALARAGQRSEAVLNRVGSAAVNVTKRVAGITVTAIGIGYATKRLFLDPFAESQDALAALTQALASTGKVGVESVGAIADEASRLQRITKAGDDELVRASATLATLAPSLKTPELVRAQTALVAISDTFTNGDLDAASRLLGKTLGSTTNALGRYGIKVDASASSSQKLAQIMGSPVLGAAFDVAQAKAATWNGQLTQLVKAGGDLRETVGEIIVNVTDLTGGAGSLADRLWALNDRIRANEARWIAWGKVGVEAVKFVAEVFEGLVRIAFNSGQMIGRAMDIAASLMLGAFLKASELVRIDWGELANAAQKLFDPLDLIPDVEFEPSTGKGDEVLAGARTQAELFKGDLGDLKAAVQAIADAWKRVQDAAEKARGASGGLGLEAGAGGGGAPPDAGALGREIQRRMRGLGGSSLLPTLSDQQQKTLERWRWAQENIRSGRVSLPDLQPHSPPMDRAVLGEGDPIKMWERKMTETEGVVVGAFGRMADAAITGSTKMEVAVLDAMSSIVANIKLKNGNLFGSTLPGAIVGLGLGLLGSFFGRDRSPMRVAVTDFENSAERKLKDAQKRPVQIHYTVESGGRPIGEIAREIADRENRDEIVHTPVGGGRILKSMTRVGEWRDGAGGYGSTWQVNK